MKAHDEQVMIGLNEEILCPHGEGHRFTLQEGLAESTIRRIQEEQAEANAKDKFELQARFEAEREAIRQAAKSEESQKAKIREQAFQEQMAAQARLIDEIRRQLSEKSAAEFNLQQSMEALKAEQNLALAKAAADARELSRIEAMGLAEKKLGEKFEQELEALRLRQRELEKQRDDAKEAAHELRRRMEQGSQQAQGEALELTLEAELAFRFPTDRVEPIANGAYGADILHTIIMADGRNCGSITWETKNAQSWNSKWLEKLRTDVISSKSEFGVLVSTALPEGVKYFDQIDGMYVCSLSVWFAVAAMLRQQIINLAFARASAEGRDQKMDVVYRYLTGPEFRERVNAIIQTFVGMQDQLSQEKRALMKHWSRREKQIQTVLNGLSGMYGDLQGIIGTASLPEIETLEITDLEDEED
ncbi:MAG TPA: DUF2130 domain-containing protein [Chthoniobacterales bacterium]|jgi:hypothetical protein|nr:DUF2130 domain-containing protein [Chthoniobacterales bacterium]